MLGNYFKKKTPETDNSNRIDIDVKTFLNAGIYLDADGWVKTKIPIEAKIRLYLLLNDFNENEVSVTFRQDVYVHSYYAYVNVVLTRGKVRSEKTITTYSRYSHPDIHAQVTQLIADFKEKEALYHKLDEYMSANKAEPELEKDTLQ